MSKKWFLILLFVILEFNCTVLKVAGKDTFPTSQLCFSGNRITSNEDPNHPFGYGLGFYILTKVKNKLNFRIGVEYFKVKFVSDYSIDKFSQAYGASFNLNYFSLPVLAQGNLSSSKIKFSFYFGGSLDIMNGGSVYQTNYNYYYSPTLITTSTHTAYNSPLSFGLLFGMQVKIPVKEHSIIISPGIRYWSNQIYYEYPTSSYILIQFALGYEF